jgi:hypothetical protein
MMKHGGVANLVVGVGSVEGLPAEVGQCGESGGAALCSKERKHAPYKNRIFVHFNSTRKIFYC